MWFVKWSRLCCTRLIWNLGCLWHFWYWFAWCWWNFLNCSFSVRNISFHYNARLLPFFGCSCFCISLRFSKQKSRFGKICFLSWNVLKFTIANLHDLCISLHVFSLIPLNKCMPVEEWEAGFGVGVASAKAWMTMILSGGYVCKHLFWTYNCFAVLPFLVFVLLQLWTCLFLLSLPLLLLHERLVLSCRLCLELSLRLCFCLFFSQNVGRLAFSLFVVHLQWMTWLFSFVVFLPLPSLKFVFLTSSLSFLDNFCVSFMLTSFSGSFTAFFGVMFLEWLSGFDFATDVDFSCATSGYFRFKVHQLASYCLNDEQSLNLRVKSSFHSVFKFWWIHSWFFWTSLHERSCNFWALLTLWGNL